MNKKTDQSDLDLKKKAERLGAWLGLVGVLFRLLIVAGLILGVLVIFTILFTSMFRLWILILPAVLIALGVLLAWLEFRLHSRYYDLQSRHLVHEDAQEQSRESH